MQTLTRRAMLFSGLAAAAAHRGLQGQQVAPVIIASWNFNETSQGWLSAYSDYATGMIGLDRQAEIAPLPGELNKSGERGFLLQGNNRSDDLFMFLSKQIGSEIGIQPNRNYWAHIHVQFASNAQTGCVGVGGAPGESVHLKGGVTGREPVITPLGDYVGLNVDKGQQAVGGQELHLMGTIANGEACGSPAGYRMLTRVLYQPVPVRSTEHGALWITVGTDSGFEGLTRIFYYSIGVALIPA